MNDIRKITLLAATCVLALLFSACSHHSIENGIDQRVANRKDRRYHREETWNQRFKRWSKDADRRAEKRWQRLMY